MGIPFKIGFFSFRIFGIQGKAVFQNIEGTQIIFLGEAPQIPTSIDLTVERVDLHSLRYVGVGSTGKAEPVFVEATLSGGGDSDCSLENLLLKSYKEGKQKTNKHKTKIAKTSKSHMFISEKNSSMKNDRNE